MMDFSDPSSDRSILKDARGAYRTNIFEEINQRSHTVSPPIYTMREDTHKGLPSAYRIYMDAQSEYEAAMILVGSWNHWLRLLKVNAFMKGEEGAHLWNGLEAWREEKGIKDRAVAYNQLKVSAATGNVQAQKMIFDGMKSAKRGRPSSSEVKREAVKMAQHASDIKDDLARLRLVANGNDSTRTG